MEIGNSLRYLSNIDHHPSSNLLQHQKKGRLAHAANARQGLHCLCYGIFLANFYFSMHVLHLLTKYMYEKKK